LNQHDIAIFSSFIQLYLLSLLDHFFLFSSLFVVLHLYIHSYPHYLIYIHSFTTHTSLVSTDISQDEYSSPRCTFLPSNLSSSSKAIIASPNPFHHSSYIIPTLDSLSSNNHPYSAMGHADILQSGHEPHPRYSANVSLHTFIRTNADHQNPYAYAEQYFGDSPIGHGKFDKGLFIPAQDYHAQAHDYLVCHVHPPFATCTDGPQIEQPAPSKPTRTTQPRGTLPSLMRSQYLCISELHWVSRLWTLMPMTDSVVDCSSPYSSGLSSCRGHAWTRCYYHRRTQGQWQDQGVSPVLSGSITS